MDYITLNSLEKMPVLGLGVFRCSPEEAYNSVRLALDAGYRYIDTASEYGNEEAVGQAIRDSGIKREELFISTKLWTDDMRKRRERKACEESLKRLGLDYLDLYLLHWPVKEVYIDSWNEMECIYRERLAKSVGVCNCLLHHLKELYEETELIPAVNQMECHPYLTQKPLVEYCQEAFIRYEAWSPLGAGKTDLLENPLIVELAKKYKKTPAQIILRWDIECGVSVIPKSSNALRQKENLDIFDFELFPSDVRAIDNLDRNMRVGSDPDNFNF